MTTQFSLWRIEAFPSGTPPCDLSALQHGLALHLRYHPLHSILVQVGAAQQSYVALPPCSGCLQARCVVGCPVEALRRTVRAGLHPTARLQRVRTGLVQRPATVAYLARPLPNAQPLDGGVLHGWAHGTLIVTWAPRHPLRLTAPRPHLWALLSAGGSGPDLAETLDTYGWHARQITPSIATALREHPAIGNLLAAPWPAAPWLSLPLPAPPVLTGASVGGSEAVR